MDTPQPARTIQDHGGLRPLDPESESEAEVLERPLRSRLGRANPWWEAESPS